MLWTTCWQSWFFHATPLFNVHDMVEIPLRLFSSKYDTMELPPNSERAFDIFHSCSLSSKRCYLRGKRRFNVFLIFASNVRNDYDIFDSFVTSLWNVIDRRTDTEPCVASRGSTSTILRRWWICDVTECDLVTSSAARCVRADAPATNNVNAASPVWRERQPGDYIATSL